MIFFFVIYQDQIETDVNLYFIEFIFKGENVIWQRGANMILARFHNIDYYMHTNKIDSSNR